MPEKGVGSLGTGVIGSCEWPDVFGSGNQTWALWKNSKHSWPLSHVSSPSSHLFAVSSRAKGAALWGCFYMDTSLNHDAFCLQFFLYPPPGTVNLGIRISACKFGGGEHKCSGLSLQGGVLCLRKGVVLWLSWQVDLWAEEETLLSPAGWLEAS